MHLEIFESVVVDLSGPNRKFGNVFIEEVRVQGCPFCQRITKKSFKKPGTFSSIDVTYWRNAMSLARTHR